MGFVANIASPYIVRKLGCSPSRASTGVWNVTEKYDSLRTRQRIVQNAEADSARQIADALYAAHVSRLGKVREERRFKEAIAAAIIAARTEGSN